MIRRSSSRLGALLDVLTLVVAGLFPVAVSAQSGTWITNAAGTYSWSQAGNWQSGIVADGADNLADFTTAGLTGPMTVNLDSSRTIGSLVFDNPTNNFNWSVLGSNPLTLSTSAAGGPLIAVNEFNLTATVATPLAGTQGLTKIGQGILTLTGTNTYSGGTTVANGTLAVNSDAALGAGPVTITSALASVNFTASTSTSKSFNLGGGTLAVSAGANVTLNGSTIIGGYLDGAGRFSTSAASGARFANVTSQPSVTIVSNSPADRFVDFANGAALTVAAGVNTAGTSTTVNLNSFTNQGSGSITIGAASKINVANFQSYGTLTLIPAVVGSGQQTLLTNLGDGPLRFNGGSRTFIGTPATAGFVDSPNNVAGIDLHGRNMVIVGGLVRNNGVIFDSVGGGNIIIGYQGQYGGWGVFGPNIVTVDGGRIGNMLGPEPGGSLIIGPGAIQSYSWQIDDARGTAGPTGTLLRGWSQLQAVTTYNSIHVGTGNLTWTATSTPGNQFNFALQTLLAPVNGTDVSGPMDSFDPNQPYVWPIITYQGTYTGPTDSATLTADTRFDLNQFQNSHPGTFSLALDSVNKAIDLVYAPSSVPEPGTLALVATAAAGLAWRRRYSRVRV